MLSSSEMKEYQRTLDGIYSAAGYKSEMSLSKWCDRTRTTAQAVKVLQDDVIGRYKRDEARYSTQENNRRWEEAQTERSAFADVARTRIERDLDSVLTAKREAFSRSMGAPSQDAIRLLQTLQMRENISAAEISATVPHLSGNLQALSVLAEVAKKNGVVFPRINTDFTATEAEIQQEVRALLNDLFSDKPTYWTQIFLSENGNNGRLRPFVDAIDSPNFFDTTQIGVTEEVNESNEPAV